jgi:hypothetical protein
MLWSGGMIHRTREFIGAAVRATPSGVRELLALPVGGLSYILLDCFPAIF